jgi:hypothetical protein
MIIYNVTVNVEESIHLDWFNWMITVHIPEVMATGMFVKHKMLKLISKQEDELGETYAIQYYAENIDKYFEYQNIYAPELRQKTLELYGEKVLAFRTLMEEM